MYKIIMSGLFCLVCSLGVQAMEPEDLLRNVGFFDFDSTKNRFVSENVSDLNRELTFKELITLVESFDFDSSKVKVVQTLRGHHEEYSDSELLELIGKLDFDSTKEEMLAVLDAEPVELPDTTSSKKAKNSVTTTKSTTITIRCVGIDCETEYVSK